MAVLLLTYFVGLRIAFWLAEDGKGRGILETRAVSGGAIQNLASGLQPVPLLYKEKYVVFPTNSLMAVSSTDVYFIDFLSNTASAGVSSVPKNGGIARTFIASHLPDAGSLNPVAPIAVVADEGSLVWVDFNANISAILDAPFPTGPERVLASNLVSPINLALGGDKILFCDIGLRGADGTVQAISKSGGTPTALLKGLSFPWAILVEDGFVYCATLGEHDNGQIVKVGLDGGAEVALVEKTRNPSPSLQTTRPSTGSTPHVGR